MKGCTTLTGTIDHHKHNTNNIKNQKVIDCFEIYNSNTRTYCDESLLSILEEKRYDSVQSKENAWRTL